MIDIISTYTPFRLKISRKEPVQLTVTVHNRSNENKMVSMEILLSNHLSLEKSGYRNSDLKKIENFAKGERKRFYYEIWPKQVTMTGEEPVRIVVREHYNNYNYVANEYSKSAPLTIED